MASNPDAIVGGGLGDRAPWYLHGAALALLGVVLAIAFLPTYQAIVGIWSRSETFAHGFLIVPIVLFLVYRLRHPLADQQPRVQPLALVPVAGLVLLWVLGALVDVDSVRHFAAVLLIPAVVWLSLGNAVAWTLLFPLAYLISAVPFGEFLVPPLMDWTADFTVWAVQQTGVPVYREGLNFELPTGRWSVVEACSGVRYLIATVALGTLYAYLVYRSWMRRLVFVAFSFLVPILANGLRAYAIVMIGHLSGMELAAGVDHLIYGWVFFGAVIALMFWIGTYWREDRPISEGAAPGPGGGGMAERLSDSTGLGSRSVAAVAGVALTGGVLVASGPLYAGWMNQRDLGPVAGLEEAELPLNDWEAIEADPWEPGYRNARAAFHRHYVDGQGVPVGVYVGYYREQFRHGNMITWDNTMAGRDRDAWRQRSAGRAEIDDWTRPARFELTGPNRQILAWRWYWVTDRLTTSPHEVKARESLSRLLGGRDDAALVVLYALYPDDPEEVEPALRRFAEAALPELLGTLEEVRGR
ncbi:exosortase A [Halorhodospira halophila]|nr:exosortase A [Halorhodospira halophila]MBK1729256.1 exosortase A [Halorhodospira halophila]